MRDPRVDVRRAIGSLVLMIAAATPPAAGAQTAPTATLDYPPARRADHVDEYHGTRVADPYRWLEDVDSVETRAWVEAEAALSSRYLAAIPGRGRIATRLREIWNYERWSPPERHGDLWVFEHNDGLQNQSVLFATADPAAPARVLLDPNTLSADGTVALGGAAFSHDGHLMAYGLSEAGSDWETWRVRDTRTGKDLPDVVRHAKFTSPSWRHDGSGFYYAGFEAGADGESLKAQNQYHTLYFHRIGTAQDKDELVYRRTDDPNWFVAGDVSDDGRYLIVTASHGTDERNTLLVADLSRGGVLKPVLAEPSALHSVLGNVGTTLYVRTDDHAPRYRIVAIDLAHPDAAHWRTVVKESADTLTEARLVGHQLVVHYLHDAYSVARRYAVDGKLLGEIALPGLGTASGFAGHLDDTSTYYVYQDYTRPPSVYRLDLATGKTSPWKEPRLAGFDPADYETRQVFYRSKDGTRVPMFVVSRRGTASDGSNPTILYGYGGFNISETPAFSPSIAAWIDLGGSYAFANLRGGGEYGRAWHEAGMKTRKQNVFDDFAAAAEHLIETRWTSPARLAIRGGSNGGLLVGAVEEQHPELFAAAIAQVGVMDMLRFREFTIGRAWESDYGSVDNKEEFHALHAYSPYHNVREGVAYPATLILTGDHDDRVYPAHSFKFAAAMQHANPTGKPVLIRIDLRAGHGAGKPVAKRVDEAADIYAFVLNAMGLAH